MTIDGIKYSLDVCESMIDRLQRELYSNGSMMGAVNSAYEKMTDEEKETYQRKRKQYMNLLSYRTSLLDYAAQVLKGITPETEPTLTVEDEFSFAD